MIRLKTNIVFTRCYRVGKVVKDEKDIQSTEDRWFQCECQVNCFKFGCISRQISIRLWVSITFIVNCLSTYFVRVNPSVSFIYAFVYYSIEITHNYEGFFIMIINELF